MICNPLKTIFVHIPKTAGQSIEQVFLSYLGLDQQSRPALLLRAKLAHELGPPRLSHLTASEYQDYGYITPEAYADYFSFAFVRNPWRRVQSFYTYLNIDQKMSFEAFVVDELALQMRADKYAWFLRPQVDFLLDARSELLVNFVGRYERLQRDFDFVMAKLNLPPTELPVMNTSGKIDFGGACHSIVPEYTSVSRQKVAELYAMDIETFDYTFDL